MERKIFLREAAGGEGDHEFGASGDGSEGGVGGEQFQHGG